MFFHFFLLPVFTLSDQGLTECSKNIFWYILVSVQIELILSLGKVCFVLRVCLSSISLKNIKLDHYQTEYSLLKDSINMPFVISDGPKWRIDIDMYILNIITAEMIFGIVHTPKLWKFNKKPDIKTLKHWAYF